ncbi:hypothetical protein [Acinetobacter sp. AG3]|uniref:hypothetical protein n=1 Tax=unclassified Acinetobacter TaxID=196816 RepID=UPI001EF124A1|nr:hypothetical protein [Acinetobacter sp. AG3]MCG7219517.1 hypothetical protein [Acinetobacter sp. AG3]
MSEKILNDLKSENQRLKYLIGEKIGHPSVFQLLSAEVNRQLQEQKDQGDKEFMTDEDIEKLIQDVLKDHDKNPEKYWHNLYAQIDYLLKINKELSNPLLQNDCMIGQTWFMKGTPVANLIKHAEGVYKAEAIAQNSKIKFGTDDNENWFAHDVPFFGTVQILNEFNEWDIHFGDCWQGPFNSKSECIQHLEECIQEKRQEDQEQSA